VVQYVGMDVLLLLLRNCYEYCTVLSDWFWIVSDGTRMLLRVHAWYNFCRMRMFLFHVSKCYVEVYSIVSKSANYYHHKCIFTAWAIEKSAKYFSCYWSNIVTLLWHNWSQKYTVYRLLTLCSFTLDCLQFRVSRLRRLRR
jgi:hypothetical protein